MGNPNPVKKFKKGERPVGRAKGTPNKIDHDVKTAILRAAALSEHSTTKDLTGYLVHLANKKQDTFAGLLGRLIPVQAKVQHSGIPKVDLNLTIDMPLTEMISNFEQRIKASIQPLQVVDAEPLQIEHLPEESDGDA